MLRRKLVDVHSPLVLFAISFTLMPFALFNQQVLTGRSLQPIHYKAFIANYAVLISIVLVFLILWRGHYAKRSIPSLLLVIITIAALGWGMVEVSSFAKREEPRARLRDDILAVANRMTTMANEDGSLQAAFDRKAPFPTVFTPTLATLEVFMAIPADSPLAVLWSLHTEAVSLSVAESKDRFYHHMYYSGLSPKELAAGISTRRFWIVAPLFGVERVYDGLALDRKAISGYELHEERATIQIL